MQEELEGSRNLRCLWGENVSGEISLGILAK